jgi:hypothetical protein
VKKGHRKKGRGGGGRSGCEWAATGSMDLFRKSFHQTGLTQQNISLGKYKKCQGHFNIHQSPNWGRKALAERVPTRYRHHI